MTYTDVFLAAVPDDKREEYIQHAEKFCDMFQSLGALEYSEHWADDVPDGKKTDMNRAVAKKEGESVVIGWMIWTDKDARDAAWEKVEADPKMAELGASLPIDGSRMIFGGFKQIVRVA